MARIPMAARTKIRFKPYATTNNNTASTNLPISGNDMRVDAGNRIDQNAPSHPPIAPDPVCNINVELESEDSSDSENEEVEECADGEQAEQMEDSDHDEQPSTSRDPQEIQIDNNYETLRDVAKKTSETALLAVLGSLFSRETMTDFMMRIDCFDDHIKLQAKELYTKIKSHFVKCFFCNGCGKTLRSKNQKCCTNVVAEVLRLPIVDQLDDITNTHLQSIINLREAIKKGEHQEHCLSGEFLNNAIKNEKSDHLKLSLLMSIDGVQIVGRKTKKIWPLSMALMDLPEELMIKSENIILGSIVMCDEIPSTNVWNKVFAMVNSAVEKIRINTQTHSIDFDIVTSVCDQPAKRKLYGMKSYNSSQGCFFCLSAEPSYKLEGECREKRGAEQTKKDNVDKVFGFCCEAEVAKKLMTFDSIIDIFHNMAEGVFVHIMQEASVVDDSERKSDLFLCDRDKFANVSNNIKIPTRFRNSWGHRNGNEKFDDFRINYLTNAIVSTSFKPAARFVIIGMGLLANCFASNSNFSYIFIKQVCECVDNLLKVKYSFYYVIKMHEILYHLADCCRKFGNVAVLSTASFETFYRVLLSDVKKSMTHNFIDYAAQRFLTQVSTRREIESRWKSGDYTDKTKNFVRDSRKFKDKSDVKLFNEVEPSTVGIQGETGWKYFGAYHGRVGHLTSSLICGRSTDDVVFFEHPIYKCGRFLYGKRSNESSKIVVEVVEELSNHKKFSKLRKCVSELEAAEKIHAKKLIELMENTRFLSVGKSKLLNIDIDINDVRGVGCSINCGKTMLAVQLTGAAYHV